VEQGPSHNPTLMRWFEPGAAYHTRPDRQSHVRLSVISAEAVLGVLRT
jgi:hypothetical protein